MDSDAEFAQLLQRDLDCDEAIDKMLNASFLCPICMEYHIMDNSIELDCRHRFCKECFATFLTNKIDQKQVEDGQLCCPMRCKTTVTVLQVQGALEGQSPRVFDRYLQTRLEGWVPPAGEVKCDCRKCGSTFTANLPAHWKNKPTEVSCPSCSSSFCPSCGFTHPGLTCEEERARVLQASPDMQASENFIKRQFTRCPCCDIPCERVSGCNYMTCPSKKCRGRTHFCYLCGLQLASSLQHVVHFPQGPYVDQCHGCNTDEPSGNPIAKAFRSGLRKFDNLLQQQEPIFGTAF